MRGKGAGSKKRKVGLAASGSIAASKVEKGSLHPEGKRREVLRHSIPEKNLHHCHPAQRYAEEQALFEEKETRAVR